MKGIPDNSIDLVATDPPYEVKKADWDIEPAGWISEIHRILKEGGAFYCFYASLKIPAIQPRIEEYFNLKNVCVWWSPNYSAALKARDRYSFAWQPCIYSTKGQKANYNTYDFSRYGAPNSNDLWKFPCPQSNYKFDKRIHVAQKPLNLIKHIVSASSGENDLIVDPFLGSGTTAVACKQLNRRWIGIEINPDYCRIAKERLMGIPDSLFKNG